MSAFDNYGENGYVGWIDTWNTCSLCKVFRFVFFQLFTAFKSDSRTLIIRQPLWNLNFFILLSPFRTFFLLLDVRGIMTHNLYFFFYQTWI